MKSKKQLKKQMENKTVLIWKMGVASALSWEIAKLAGSTHPYLAPISVILCLQTTIDRSIRFSYQRMVGTVIGIVIVVLLEPFVNVNGWTLGSLIIVGCFIAKWLKREETAIHQVALTVLLVFVLGKKAGDYPIDRFRDTLIGALAAVLIQMMIHPPNYSKQALTKCSDCSSHIASVFTKLALWLENGSDLTQEKELQNDLKKLQQELQLCKFVLKDAKESLKYNPFGQKSNVILEECDQKMMLFSEGYIYLKTTVDTFIAWAKAGSLTTTDQITWANQQSTIAHFFTQSMGQEESRNLLTISLPAEQKNHQYQVALYQGTSLFLEKIKTVT
ncbi:FUSC family protein [Neobacillus drentensis]|uniref:FUSC family protein n=1 Tax=Neobacillus drentensis TaxID=220684 RepID=UPI001F1C02A3|nr:FUSC family protein [Neobacillus drentensis]ULT54768.1 FUSC family protein [Neobacillus drentensis]